MAVLECVRSITQVTPCIRALAEAHGALLQSVSAGSGVLERAAEFQKVQQDVEGGGRRYRWALHERVPEQEALLASAYHEAGHAILGYALDFKIHYVWIASGQDVHNENFGGTQMLEGRRRAYDPRTAAEHYAIYGFAGFHASLVHDPTAPPSGCDEDFQVARQDYMRLSGVVEPELTNHLATMHMRTAKLVRDCWVGIDSLAKTLVEKKNVDGLEVFRIVERTIPDSLLIWTQ